MYGRKEIFGLRLLTGDVLDFTEKSLQELRSDDICKRDFDEISITLASRLNYVGCLYEELADRVGMMRFDERGECLPELISPAIRQLFAVR